VLRTRGRVAVKTARRRGGRWARGRGVQWRTRERERSLRQWRAWMRARRQRVRKRRAGRRRRRKAAWSIGHGYHGQCSSGDDGCWGLDDRQRGDARRQPQPSNEKSGPRSCVLLCDKPVTSCRGKEAASDAETKCAGFEQSPSRRRRERCGCLRMRKTLRTIPTIKRRQEPRGRALRLRALWRWPTRNG
jgi:hypothetical protein